MIWTDDRCAELDKLFQLLIEVIALNHGSNVVSRIQKCEQLAKELHMYDIGSGRASFHGFLMDLAIADRASNTTSSPHKEAK